MYIVDRLAVSNGRTKLRILHLPTFTLEKKRDLVCETSWHKIKKKQEIGNLPHTSTAYCYVYCWHNEIALNTVYKMRRLRGSSRLQTGISSKMRTPHFKHSHNFNKYLHIYLYVNIFIGKVTPSHGTCCNTRTWKPSRNLPSARWSTRSNADNM